MSWIDREEDRIERDYEEGLISSDEAARCRRELQAEIEAEAQEAADQAYDAYMGRF